MPWQEFLRRLGLTEAQILRLTALMAGSQFPSRFLNPFPVLARPERAPSGGTLGMLDRVFGRPEGLELSPAERGTQVGAGTFQEAINALLGRQPAGSLALPDVTGIGSAGDSWGLLPGEPGYGGAASGTPDAETSPLTPPELPDESYGMGGGWIAR